MADNSKGTCLSHFKIYYGRKKFYDTGRSSIKPFTNGYGIQFGRLLVLPANIRLGEKRLTVINTLAYFSTEIIKAVVSFIVSFRYETFNRRN